MAASVEPGDATNAAVRVLVIDDDEIDRLTVRRLLRDAGILAAIDEASSAAEALERAEHSEYDCILLDYYMPDVDTLALLRELRGHAEDVPVVVFTGHGNEEVAVQFMQAGAVDYLAKASLTPLRLARSFRSALDVTRAAAAEQRALAKLREREAEFRTLANAIPQLAWMADADGRRYWYNSRWYEYTGLRPDQCLGLGWRLVHHPDHRARVFDDQLRSFKSGEAWEDTVYLRRGDGQHRWFLACAMPVRDSQGRVLHWVGTATDVTERKEAEVALVASEERLRRALEIETVGVLFFRMTGEITGANDAFLRMSGYTRCDVSSAGLRWDALIPPEFLEQSLSALEELKATGRTAPNEKQYIRKDGSRWWALFAATQLYAGEGVGFVLDITSQKQAELERERSLADAQAARAEAERATRARDDMLAVVAHDLRSPLQSILARAQVMASVVDGEQRTHVAAIERAAAGMGRLIADLLDMARIEAGTLTIHKAAFEVQGLVHDAVALFDAQAHTRKVSLRAAIDHASGQVVADRDRLLQVLSNLIGNALRFSAPGGSVRVRVADDNNGVQVSVKDSGKGIAAEDLPRIFDRYWQADRLSRGGAGLGLAICKAIVEAHDGKMWAASTVGRGTTIYFWIPSGGIKAGVARTLDGGNFTS